MKKVLNINKIKNIFTYVAIVTVVIVLTAPLFNIPASAKSTGGLDEYGLKIRNNSENLPSWYPKSEDVFLPFHDPDVSRVVDMADIFTDEEEAEMREKIIDITAKTNKDIVVVTADSDYGLGHELYCNDFYDYNGYGKGEEYEGICLFICMDPENRGGWASTFGSESRGLYTEVNANLLDDDLYSYLGRGDYGEGVLDWIDNIGNLFTKGVVFSPDWYPSAEEKDTYVRTHNPEALRVVDNGKKDGSYFSQKEIENLTQKAKQISDDYGIDVVIHTTPNAFRMSNEQYTGDFYYYNGYGLGPDFDGVILCIFCDYASFYIYPFGKVAETLQDTNLKRLKGHLEDKLYYYDMAETFLDELEHMEKTGRIPRDAGQWLFCAIVSVLVGAFVGKKFLNKARKNMVTVRSVYGADNYVTSSSDFRTGNDTFINRNVQKTKIPRTTYSSGSSSSRSSSSGRSTYHSSSRGSSGRTHTGSGRRF